MLERGAQRACQFHHTMTVDETKRLLAYRHSIARRLQQVASCENIYIVESSVKPLMSEIFSFFKDFSDLATKLTAQTRS